MALAEENSEKTIEMDFVSGEPFSLSLSFLVKLEI